MRNTGPVLLAADVAHDRFNMDHRCVPTMNSDIGESLRSMSRVDALVGEQRAQLWLNHDIVQTATSPHDPAYFD